jgi:argininosuccinate synthase
MAYHPEKLSMEKVESIFTPEDRIGALEMQTLSIGDNRAHLLHYIDTVRRLGPGSSGTDVEKLLEPGEDASD